MFGAKLTFLVSVVSFTSIWSTNSYSFEKPIKFFLNITEAPNEPMQEDSICDNMDEDERKKLCENEAIAVCGESQISVQVDRNKALGKKAMYTFHAAAGFQPRGSKFLKPACSCPTTPTIYFGEAPAFAGPDTIRISVEKPSDKSANKNKRSSESTSSSSESGKETKSRRRSPRFLHLQS